MPTIPVAGFVGPTNVQRARTLDAEQTINWFTEIVNAGAPKVQAALQPTPAVTPFVGLYAGPVRALFAQNGRAFAVGGGVLHEILGSQTATIRGTVAVDGNPAQMASNGLAGNQLMIVSGGLGYIFDLVANTLTQITDDSFPDVVTQVLFFDGFFIVLTPTGEFFLSSLEDGTTWNALDFAAENQFSDTVVAMSKTHDNLWLYGTQNTGPYYNSGQPISPYIPIPGSLIEHGILAPFSAVELDNTTYWLSQDEHGRLGICSGQGYTPVKVSNPAIDYKLSQSQRLSQSLAFSYQLGANLFYCLYVPDLDTTIVYNLATKQFHEWGHWDTRLLRYIPHVARNHVYAFGKHLFGSRLNRVIYELDESAGADELVTT
jgi:hypothetical protein